MNSEPPPAPGLVYAFTIAIELVPVRWIAPTAMGDTRGVVMAASGTVSGPKLSGRVIPMSGGDYALQRPNGVIDFDARYVLEADDGATIYVQNRGYRWARTAEIAEKMAQRQHVDAADYYMRVSPRFEAPAGPHEWLTKHVFVGIAEKLPTSNCIHYFQVL
jgi:hypothetical protein